MADLNQFINPDFTSSDVLHGNGYGAAAGGAAAGGLSMDQRRKILNQPRVVGAYQYSRLGRQGSSYKARTADQKGQRAYDASTDTFTDGPMYGRNRQQGENNGGGRQTDNSINRRQHFIEPSKRGYDKYA